MECSNVSPVTQDQLDVLRAIVGIFCNHNMSDPEPSVTTMQSMYDDGTITNIPKELLEEFFATTKGLISDMIVGGFDRGLLGVSESTAFLTLLTANIFYNLGMRDQSIEVRIALGGMRLHEDDTGENQ